MSYGSKSISPALLSLFLSTYTYATMRCSPPEDEHPLKGRQVADTISEDSALYSSVPFGQVPSNGFWFLNNNYGKGDFANKIDYCSILTASASTFPEGASIVWNWPDATSGSPFAYAFPVIVYGGTPYGNPYKTRGAWPQQIAKITKLAVTYDITLSGNVNSYNVLLDMYATAGNETVDGSHIAEVSFFPHLSDPRGLTGLHTFSWGVASVSRQDRQISIRPVNAGGTPRTILVGSIDLKELLSYLVSLGWISGEEYIRGVEFGVEVQVPNTYNITPHRGKLTVNRLSYEWQ